VNRCVRSVLIVVVAVAAWAGPARADDPIPEPTVPEAWRALDVEGLKSLAGELAAQGDSAQGDRALLGQYVGFRFLNDVSAARSVGIGSFGVFAKHLGKDMPGALLVQWRARSRAAFAPDQTAACGLTDGDFDVLTNALRRLGDEGVPALWAWRVAGKYLTDQATIKSVSLEQWRAYVLNSLGGLAEPERQDWHTKLTAAFASSSEALGGLSDEEFKHLTYLLSKLAETNGKCLVASRMTGRDLVALQTIRAIELEEWHRRVSTYWRAMPDAMRTLWVAKLREAFAATQEGVCALEDQDFAHLVNALRGLKDEALAPIYAMRASGRWLADAAAIRSATPTTWQYRLKQCKDALTAEAKAEWAGKLREAFVGDQAFLSSGSDEEFGRLVGALRALDDQEHMPALMVSRMTAKDMKDTDAVRSVSVRKWRDRANRYGEVMSDDTRSLWAAKLRAAFAGSREAIVAIDAEAVRDLANALAALGDNEADSLTLTWSAAPEAWQAADIAGICAIASTLARAGADRAAARSSLAEHIAGKYMADPAAVRSAGLERWQRLLNCLVADMSEPTRRSWATGLRGAYASGPEALSAVDAEGFLTLVRLLEKLGDEQTPSLAMAWMGASDAWRLLDGRGLHALAKKLNRLGREGGAARATLGEHLAALCTQDPARARAIGCARWSSLARELRKDAVPAPVRQALAAAIRSVFADNPAVLSELRPDELRALIQTLRELGDPNVGELIPQAMKTSEAWETDDPAWFLRNLPAFGEGVAAARQRLAQQVEAQCLGSEESIRQVRLASWEAIARSATDALTAEQRARWVQALRGAFVDSGLELTPKESVSLVKTLTYLGDPNAALYARAWLDRNRDQLAASPPDYGCYMVATAARAGGPAVKALLKEADAVYRQRLQEDQVSVDEAVALGWAWLVARDKAKADDWAMQAHNLSVGSEELRQSAGFREVNRVAHLFYAAWMAHEPGRIVPDKGYVGFASAAAELARQGALDDGMTWQQCRSWGAMLGTAETREILKAALADPAGQPRLAVARIVAWACARNGELDAWREYLDGRIDAASGDTKARWLLARAEAEAVRSPRYLAIRGRPWMSQALAAAASEACRVEALARLVLANADAGRFDLAESLLESVRDQFSAECQALELAPLAIRVDDLRNRAMAERIEAAQRVAERRARYRHAEN